MSKYAELIEEKMAGAFSFSRARVCVLLSLYISFLLLFFSFTFLCVLNACFGGVSGPETRVSGSLTIVKIFYVADIQYVVLYLLDKC